MPSFKVPFWIVRPRPLLDSQHGPPHRPRQVLAFSSSERAFSYILSRPEQQWNVQRINQNRMVLLVADLHAHGSLGLHYDPEPDGAGGESIPLSEIVQAMKQTACG
jgi:hypothetical protein